MYILFGGNSLKEYKVKEVADLLGKHEKLLNVRYGQANSLTLIEIAIKKAGD